MSWDVLWAGLIGGVAGAGARECYQALWRSDWLFRRIISSDARIIARAQRRAKR